MSDALAACTAVRGLHAAALPLEADWTPQLRAAFGALAGCGVVAGEPAEAAPGAA